MRVITAPPSSAYSDHGASDHDLQTGLSAFRLARCQLLPGRSGPSKICTSARPTSNNTKRRPRCLTLPGTAIANDHNPTRDQDDRIAEDRRNTPGRVLDRIVHTRSPSTHDLRSDSMGMCGAPRPHQRHATDCQEQRQTIDRHVIQAELDSIIEPHFWIMKMRLRTSNGHGVI